MAVPAVTWPVEARPAWGATVLGYCSLNATAGGTTVTELITDLRDADIDTQWLRSRASVVADDDATDPGQADDDATDPGGPADADGTDGGGDADGTDADADGTDA